MFINLNQFKDKTTEFRGEIFRGETFRGETFKRQNFFTV